MAVKSTIRLLIFCALYISFSAAIKCGQTSCDDTKGGYCCAEDFSDNKPKKCCCTGVVPTNYTQSCQSSSGLPVWAIAIIVIVVLGVVGGAAVGVFFFLRKRRAAIPYTSSS